MKKQNTKLKIDDRVIVDDKMIGTLIHISDINAQVVFDHYIYSNDAYPYHNINPKRIKKYFNNFPETFILSPASKEKEYEVILRTKAKPPIKGKITKGKIQWRGIKEIKQGNKFWLTQRGKKL